jgi:hypothetical protein
VHRLPEKHGCVGGANPAPSSYSYSAPVQGPYPDADLELAQRMSQGATAQQPREYVWEPKITEIPENPFDPSSGVVLKGVFWPRGKEIFHVLIAFFLMFLIGMFISNSIFSQSSLISLPGFEVIEQQAFPYLLASMSTGGFLIHEFAHRQTGRRYKLPAKFRLLTFGLLITFIGIIGYLAVGMPPFALPGAVVVIGLENRDQAGKCKAAGPASNLVISLVLLPLAFAS